MTAQLRPLLVVFAWLTALTGGAYPLLVTLIAQGSYTDLANGSVVMADGRAVGSELIGQSFTTPEYFWGRLSATGTVPYNAFNAEALTASSGANLGPLSQTLVDTVQARVTALRAADPGNTAPIPVDLVTASASGLDPHISVAAAEYQASRVARARGLTLAEVQALVSAHTEGRTFGLLGEPRVNVLQLNLALDGLQ